MPACTLAVIDKRLHVAALQFFDVARLIVGGLFKVVQSMRGGLCATTQPSVRAKPSRPGPGRPSELGGAAGSA